MNNLSFNGKLFILFSRFCKNFKSFLSMHNTIIEIIFLMIYVLLQLILVVSIYFFNLYTNLIIGIFIVLFLFFLSLERIILQYKSKITQEEKDNIKNSYLELGIENKLLREKQKILSEKVKSLLNIS